MRSGVRTVAELADRLGVDGRTVRRYVDHLLGLDVPVESVRGRHGGYRLAHGYRMPPLMLNDEEALAVLLGLVAGRQAGGLPMSPRINHVGGCFDDLPEGTVGTVVVNAPSVVRAQFLQHAEADEPTEFLSHLSLQDHLAGWFGLVET